MLIAGFFLNKKNIFLKIIAIIPAHLASVRFPRKILFPIFNLPMIEHVRRRALVSNVFSSVFVATCDEEIENLIKSNGGNVILTSNKHLNGTSRIAEAVEKIDCTHVVLLQGDEPLVLPEQLKLFKESITLKPEINSWNATGKIENSKDLNKHSFVKCIVSENNNITKCFRYFKELKDININKNHIKKILGIIAFKKDFLKEISNKPESFNEKKELIEQMRIIDNGYELKSISISPTLPSINEPNEVEIVKEYVLKDRYQQRIINQILELN